MYSFRNIYLEYCNGVTLYSILVISQFRIIVLNRSSLSNISFILYILLLFPSFWRKMLENRFSFKELRLKGILIPHCLIRNWENLSYFNCVWLLYLYLAFENFKYATSSIIMWVKYVCILLVKQSDHIWRSETRYNPINLSSIS